MVDGIQIIQNKNNDGVIHMAWNGYVTLYNLQTSLSELIRILHMQTKPINLVITVGVSTYLTKDISHCNVTQNLTTTNLLGWIVVGDNAPVNRFVTQLMHHLVDMTDSQTRNNPLIS